MEEEVEEDTKIASSSSKRINPCPNWSQLPPELLHLISQKLTLIFDYISFRSVCSPWRSVAKPTGLPPQLPLLIIPHDPALDDDDGNTLRMFSLSNNKLYRFPLPDASEKRCFGLNHGWLLVLGTDPSVFLLNPFTMSRLQLPPLTTIPGVFGFDPKRVGMEYDVTPPGGYRLCKSRVNMRDELVIQAAISSNPSIDDNDCVVMVALFHSSELAFCRPGEDRRWTAIEASFHDGVHVLAYHDRKFYGIDGDGSVVAHDVAVSPPSAKVIASVKRYWGGLCYLVSSDVGLLLIVRYRHWGDEGDAVGGKDSFDMFKMDVPEGKVPQWEKINNIDGEALFLCENHGVALKTGAFPGIRPNCIYYSNPFCGFVEFNRDGHHVGVFNVEDTSIMMIRCHPKDSLDWNIAAWLRPGLS